MSDLFAALFADLSLLAAAHNSPDPVKRRDVRERTLYRIIQFFSECQAPANFLSPLWGIFIDLMDLDAGITPEAMRPLNPNNRGSSAKRIAEAALSVAIDARYARIGNYGRAAELVVRDVDKRLRRRSTRPVSLEDVLSGHKDAKSDVVSRICRSRTSLSGAAATDEETGVVFYRQLTEIREGAAILPDQRQARGYSALIRHAVDRVLQAADVC